MTESQTKFKFEVEPLGLPDAGALITSFRYDIFNKMLHVVLTEDENLNAYRWIVAIKDIYDRANTHSNVRANDQIAVHMFNNDKKIGTIRFGRLLVANHRCDMIQSDWGVDSNDFPTHTVDIGFEKFELDA